MKIFSAPVALAGATAGVAIAATSCATSDLVTFSTETIKFTSSTQGTNADTTLTAKIENFVKNWNDYTEIKSATLVGTYDAIKSIGSFTCKKEATTSATNADPKANELNATITLADGKNIDKAIEVTLKITVVKADKADAEETFTHTFSFVKKDSA